MRFTYRADGHPNQSPFVLVTLIGLLAVAIFIGAGSFARSERNGHSPLACAAPVPVVEKRIFDEAFVERPEDPEQWAAAVEEFRAMSDATTQIQPEEMAAYWRVMSWVQNQPEKSSRGTTAQRTAFLHHPERFRGKRFSLDLQVCRVLSFDAPENSLGIEKLYEVWGWTRDSGAWLYVAVVPELPRGFPTGETVSERALLNGYFFKLQGYMEAGAAPRSKPLKAPMFLGKLTWQPSEPQPFVQDYQWMVGVGILGLWILYRVVRAFRGQAVRSNRFAPQPKQTFPLTADQWVQRMQQGPGDSPPDNRVKRD